VYDDLVRVLGVASGLVTACSFQPGVGTMQVSLDAPPTVDVLDIDAPPDTPPTPLCDPGNTMLRACFTFDGDGQDGSSYGNHLTINGMTFAPGRTGEAMITSTGTAASGATTSLNVTALTIDLWIRPSTIPTGGARAGLVDSGGRYRVFALSDGALRCSLSPGGTTEINTATGVITAGTWQRVTCTYGGGAMRLYVDGTMVGIQASGAAILTSPGGLVAGHNSPTGENFDGALDDLRIFGAVVPP
jgi:hypothetical protein